MKIYIASAMFANEEKDRINRIAKFLRSLGHTVYVPHEFQIPNAKDMPNKEWAKTVFETDLKALNEADAVYYFCEGMEGDIGAAWECGYAYAKGKRIFVEELEFTDEISLMVGQCSETEISSYQS
jgi:nucleoside 2-deoxyribosyltransferase